MDVDLVDRLRAAGCVHAEEEAALLTASAAGAELESLVARRVAGEPLEHLLGWASFYGLPVAVTPGVFVPRRRTELLVRLALELLDPTGVVVDLCCGSGAVGAAVAAGAPAAEMYAADLDRVAVECARRNLPPERVFEGDLFAALPPRLQGRVDVLVANAPYVPTAAIATMPAEARDHEPRLALDGGSDGLAVQRRVIERARDWLRRGGSLVVETGRDQADRTAAACRAAGLEPHVVCDDDLDGTAVVGVSRPRARGRTCATWAPSR